MSRTPPDILFSEEQIADRVRKIAAQISADHQGQGEIVLIGVLKGAFIFLADIARRLSVPRSVEFIAVSSYEDGSRPSGAVRLIMDVRASIAGRHVARTRQEARP